MFRAMALKEFREIRGIALLALAAYGLLVAAAIGSDILVEPFRVVWLVRSSGMGVPFVNDDFVGRFYLISVVFTIALGLRQTLGESIRGTYPFLLHRPADRRWLIGVKLLVGTTAVPDLHGGSDSGLRLLGRHAGHPCQSVRVVDDRADLGWLVRDDASLSGRISHGHSAGPMVSVAASAVGGCGVCDVCRSGTCRCVRGFAVAVSDRAGC